MKTRGLGSLVTEDELSWPPINPSQSKHPAALKGCRLILGQGAVKPKYHIPYPAARPLLDRGSVPRLGEVELFKLSDLLGGLSL